MSCKESEVLIVKNPLSGRRKMTQQTEQIYNAVENPQVRNLSELEKGEIRNIPKKVIILGGNGTINACISWLSKNDERPLVLIAGGGTDNILRKVLVKNGATLSLHEVGDTEKANVQAVAFRPGIIETVDGRHQGNIIIGAGFGDFEKSWSRHKEHIRLLPYPPFTRKYLAGLLAIITSLHLEKPLRDPLLQIYSTISTVGSLRVFSDSELGLDGAKLGLVEIKDDDPKRAVAKLLSAIILWRAKVIPPSSLAETKYSTDFIRQGQNTEVLLGNIDGEIKTIAGAETLRLTRDKNNFLTMALIL